MDGYLSVGETPHPPAAALTSLTEDSGTSVFSDLEGRAAARERRAGDDSVTD